jgi:hypothetical protein
VSISPTALRTAYGTMEDSPKKDKERKVELENLLPSLWSSTTENFDAISKKPIHTYGPGEVKKFYCDINCKRVTFSLKGDVVWKTEGPGEITAVPEDVRIMAYDGKTKGT